jgi:hypothetical protein
MPDETPQWAKDVMEQWRAGPYVTLAEMIARHTVPRAEHERVLVELARVREALATLANNLTHDIAPVFDAAEAFRIKQFNFIRKALGKPTCT